MHANFSTRRLAKEKLGMFPRTHGQIKVVKIKLAKENVLVSTRFNIKAIKSNGVVYFVDPI